MKTSAQWLEQVLASTEKLEHWLKRQYIGERLAAHRITMFSLYPSLSADHQAQLQLIAQDETKHAEWVGWLLDNRNIPHPEVSYKDDRYWAEVLPVEMTTSEVMASGHHAETMRLHRITLLANDHRVPPDIREVFTMILPDEQRHARMFKDMSTARDIELMEPYHQAGLQALGLEV